MTSVSTVGEESARDAKVPTSPMAPRSVHDCRAHSPKGPAPPLARALPSEHRETVTEIGIAGPTRGVHLRKKDEGWFVSGNPGCLVHPDRVMGLIDQLSSLDSDPVQALPAGLSPSITVTAEVDGRQVLAFELAGTSDEGDYAVMRDESVVRYLNLRREWFLHDPQLWCR